MTDNHEEIQDFLKNLPDEYDILEEGIDLQTQMEYIDHSHSFDRGELSEIETIGLSSILFDLNASLQSKKKVLSLLAHLGTVLAFRQIEKYYQKPDKDLKKWTALALQECKMFLECELTDESTGFISSGLGGLRDKLRYYIMVLPSTDRPFTTAQKKIIKDEFTLAGKDLNSIIELIDISDTFAGLTVLVPMDVAVGTFIETGIKKCNESGNFVFEHYYVTNQNIPDETEINDIIKIVKDG